MPTGDLRGPYANVDEANHAANENLELSRYYGGVKISAHVYEALAHESSQHLR